MSLIPCKAVEKLIKVIRFNGFIYLCHYIPKDYFGKRNFILNPEHGKLEATFFLLTFLTFREIFAAL
jgi:hypothetical protein